MVVELSLPEADGANIVQILKEENPDLKIIVLSFYDDADIVKTVLDTGAIGFVLKRTAGDDLLPGSAAATRAITIKATPEQVWPWLVWWDISPT